jgi:hypothetical protein
LLRGLLKELQAGLEQRTPLGIGQPGDIAGLVAFLAGKEGLWIHQREDPLRRPHPLAHRMRKPRSVPRFKSGFQGGREDEL